MADPSKLFQQQKKQESPDELDARILAAARAQADTNAENNKSSGWSWMPTAATSAVLIIGITFAFNTSLFRNNSFESDELSSEEFARDTFAEEAAVDSSSGDTNQVLSDNTALFEIQEIVVTGRQREEPVQEVPVSVEVLDDDSFQEVLTVDSLAEVAPDLPYETNEIGSENLQPLAKATSPAEASPEPKFVDEEIALTDVSEDVVPNEDTYAAISRAPDNVGEPEEIIVAAVRREEAIEEPQVYADTDGSAEDYELDEVIVTGRRQEHSPTFLSAVAGLFNRENMEPDLIEISSLIPDIILDIQYTSSANFVGQPIDGYESPKALLSGPAANALAAVQSELAGQGLSLKIFDAYRPQRAVDHFIRWSENDDESTKTIYYPNIGKSDLFDAGYLAERSSHSRGSTVDLTIVRINPDGSHEELDMGTIFDFFDPTSWPNSTQVSETAQTNRRMLRDLMTKHGFEPFQTEWWHFTLKDEPYPNQYFDMLVE